jgi:putative membrane protein
MSENPYERFEAEELALRDELAIDRTMLANERTALAYFRSALTLIIVGLTFIHFFKTGFLLRVGIFLIPFGLCVGIFGFIRCRKMGRSIASIRRSLREKQQEKNDPRAPAKTPPRP